MRLVAGVLKEIFPGERRVAIVPSVLNLLAKAEVDVWVESQAGAEAGFPDEEYEAKGASVKPGAKAVRDGAEVLLQVRAGQPDQIGQGRTLIALCDPLGNPELAQQFAQAGVTLFSMELIPRITRAQSMDVLSSMASIAGYKAALIAANALPRLFPMMTTAAGTLPPARVLVIGGGVAGLQAIATTRRLGAVVSGYDVRAAVKEQIESLGAKFVEINLQGVRAEGEGGYARALDDESYRRQREQMASVLKAQDVVITTAAVPGKKAPLLISREMVHMMSPGSVIVDLAAQRGGNCELTKADETVVERGVTVLGPLNLPSTVPYHASQMYARNIIVFFKHLLKDGQLNIDLSDEITRETLVARGGDVVNPKVQALLGVSA
ncbi:MAG: Re/Si-specific NAD(P)(+) transhydrogenase subunit alpha [Bryobacteraceae bacterium]